MAKKFKVRFYRDGHIHHSERIYGSKAVGEPSLFLGSSRVGQTVVWPRQKIFVWLKIQTKSLFVSESIKIKSDAILN